MMRLVTEQHRWSSRQIGEACGWDYRAVQRWHAQGNDAIVVALRHTPVVRNG